MGFGVQYRRYGFTLPQTASLMDGGDAAEQLSALRARTDEMELEIERRMRERTSLKTQIARAERAQRLFARYAHCTDIYLRKFAQGRNIERLTVAV